jgi:hypothetical protein
MGHGSPKAHVYWTHGRVSQVANVVQGWATPLVPQNVTGEAQRLFAVVLLSRRSWPLPVTCHYFRDILTQLPSTKRPRTDFTAGNHSRPLLEPIQRAMLCNAAPRRRTFGCPVSDHACPAIEGSCMRCVSCRALNFEVGVRNLFAVSFVSTFFLRVRGDKGSLML